MGYLHILSFFCNYSSSSCPCFSCDSSSFCSSLFVVPPPSPCFCFTYTCSSQVLFALTSRQLSWPRRHVGSIAPARSVFAYLRTHAVAAMPSDSMFMWAPCTGTSCGPVRGDGSRQCEARVDPLMQNRVDGHTLCSTCLECCFLKRRTAAGQQKQAWEVATEECRGCVQRGIHEWALSNAALHNAPWRIDAAIQKFQAANVEAGESLLECLYLDHSINPWHLHFLATHTQRKGRFEGLKPLLHLIPEGTYFQSNPNAFSKNKCRLWSAPPGAEPRGCILRGCAVGEIMGPTTGPAIVCNLPPWKDSDGGWGPTEFVTVPVCNIWDGGRQAWLNIWGQKSRGDWGTYYAFPLAAFTAQAPWWMRPPVLLECEIVKYSMECAMRRRSTSAQAVGS